MIQYYPSCNQCARYQPQYKVKCPKAFTGADCKDQILMRYTQSAFDADKRALKGVVK